MITIKQTMTHSKYYVLDGCSTGWLSGSLSNNTFSLNYLETLQDLPNSKKTTYYIDIPICLPTDISHYPRKEDQVAKKKLSHFHSSIFYAPLSEWLTYSYHDINLECDYHRKPKISKQSFHLFSKISEAQDILKTHNNSIQEIHPELIIHHFLGTSKQSKKTLDGIQQRLHLIHDLTHIQLSINDLQNTLNSLKSNYPKSVVKLDDLIDVLSICSVIKAYPEITKPSTNRNIQKETELNERFNIFKPC
tara:strand:- start:87 stop:830 length:744 start_codon:yes stop_codon:yes gene_type:complete